MKMWFSAGKKFEEEFSDYLKTSRKFRASCRSSSIVIVLDEKTETYDLLKFVAEKCKADLMVYRFDEAYNALRFIETSGCANVRCMIVDANIILTQNGELLGKLKRQFPRVPIFVKGWDDSQKPRLDAIHHVSLLPQQLDESAVEETLGIV